ncbi:MULTISPECIES: hypothetical protein [Aerosakkonema]|uniref:hypothetical protein n=1 Tax=Aerosakkonema TaxID=1246629 RepID=UPI0035BC0B1C
MNPQERSNTPSLHNRQRLKCHYFLSYSGLALASFYLVVAINVAIQEQHNFRTGCIISCFNGLLTIALVSPAFLLADLLGIAVKEFDVRNWFQVAPYIGFTALLVYLIGTGLEKLGCYLINRLRRS